MYVFQVRGYAAQVIDAAKKIRYAVMQIPALHLHGYCIAENAALGLFAYPLSCKRGATPWPGIRAGGISDV